MVTIANLAALRAFVYSPGNEVVFVEGYSSTGDGGEGLFFWESASIQDDNDGTIVKVSSVATGRWKRDFSDAVSVKWFGAIGNGATDDTDAIQRAMAANIGKVVFEKGNYLVTDTLSLPSAVVVDFNNSVITFDNSVVDKSLFSITRKTKIVLRNGIWMDKFNGTSKGLYLVGEPSALWPVPANHYTSDVLVDAIQIVGFKLGIHQNNATRRLNITNCNLYCVNGVRYEGKTVENVIDGTVIYCSALVNGCYGVGSFGRTEHVTMYPEGLTITNCTIDAFYNSFHIENIYTLQVTNNYLGANPAEGNSTFYFKKGPATHTTDLLISNNLIYGRGIVFDPQTSSPYKFKAQISNCNFLAQRGVNVTLNNWASFVAIRGCKFADSGTGGKIAINAVSNNLNLTVSDIEIDETYVTAPVQIKGANSLNSSLSGVNYRGTGATFYLQQSPYLGGGVVNSSHDLALVRNDSGIVAGTYAAGTTLATTSAIRLGLGQQAMLVISGHLQIANFTELNIIFPANISFPSGTGWSAAKIAVNQSQYLNVVIPIVALLPDVYTFSLENDAAGNSVDVSNNAWVSVRLT